MTAGPSLFLEWQGLALYRLGIWFPSHTANSAKSYTRPYIEREFHVICGNRGRYTLAHEIRHCRETAPTPKELAAIERWFRDRKKHQIADFLCFSAYSGLRIGETLPLDWEKVDWINELIHVRRQKRGINPWVKMSTELKELLVDMQKRANGHLLFSSPFNNEVPVNDSAIRRRIKSACTALGIRPVTPHGLRSFFVTQCRKVGFPMRKSLL